MNLSLLVHSINFTQKVSKSHKSHFFSKSTFGNFLEKFYAFYHLSGFRSKFSGKNKLFFTLVTLEVDLKPER
jgi:hypothetical protein